MTEVLLNNVPVRFPYEPYELQTNYMKKVIECLQEGKNGILESPTGTGKTLSLLCSSLAWLEVKKAELSARSLNASMKEDCDQTHLNSLTSQLKSAVGGMWKQELCRPKIIYSSRTHSQLTQAVNELKKTTYRHMKVSIIGSRDQFCIHPEVSKETNNSTKVQMCQIRTKGRNCYFYNKVEHMKMEPEVKEPLLDIEDLVKLGKKRTFCPYYMAKELAQDADIIFLPYNYLLDPKSRSSHNIKLEGNIVIFDEAHNVEKMCEEAASLQFKSTDIALCIDEVTHVMKKFQELADNASGDDAVLPADFSPEDLYILKTIFLELEKAVDDISLPAEGGLTFPGNFMLELLQKADLTPSKKAVIMDLLDKLIQYLTMNASSPFQRKGAGLQKFSTLIQTVFSRDQFSVAYMELINQCYKVHIVPEEKKKHSNKDGWNAVKPNSFSAKSGKVISFWCLNPGFGMKSLVELGIHCFILTSGTLSPLESFTSELQVSFPVQLENPHIIKPCQVWVGTLTKGPDGCVLSSSFQNRDKVEYLNSLGMTIRNFSRIIPGGLLVFFPSYTTLRKCQEHWQNSGLWTTLSNSKPIFVEPQTRDAFVSTIDGFYEKVRDPSLKGACFLAVCRGKVSEGLDFANRNGRAVIITGLPYPPFFDPRVKLKQKYLDEVRARNKKGLTGTNWYRLEASRAVNQAIGRVIRHKDDFGAIILCDKRFNDSNFKQELSSWVRPHVKVHENFGTALKELIQFFRITKSMFPEPVEENKCCTNSSSKSPVKIRYEDGPSSYSVPVVANAFEITSGRLVSNACRKEAQSTETDSLQPKVVYGSCNSSTNGESISNIPLKSLFTAEGKDTSVLDFNSCQTTSKSSSWGSEESHSNLLPKRKRIKVVNNFEKGLKKYLTGTKSREGNSNGGATSENQSSKGNNTTEGGDYVIFKQMKVAKYIKDVKSVLTGEEYKRFSEAIKKYKAVKDFDCMLATLLSLFGEDSDRHPFLIKFTLFLRPEHKQQLETIYREMTAS